MLAVGAHWRGIVSGSSVSSSSLLKESCAAVELFVIEQPAFAFDAAAVAVECAVGGDHAMAWDDDRDPVFAIGEPDGSGAAGVVELIGDLPV